MWRIKPNLVACHKRSLQQVVSRHMSASTEGQKVMGIRREDYGSQWERRAPLSPAHVKTLIESGVKVLVQDSNRRAYPIQDYENAGAHIQEDLSEASFILGVKQVPIPRLIANKTFCFFSHTIKAQLENMPLLDAILEKNIRLIDYEKIVDDSGKRLVAFGKFAGLAGMINILHGMGLRLLALGHHTPFLHIAAAHNYRDSSMARQAVREAGYEIALGRLPKSIGPMTFVFMGSGNVSQGAQEIISELPVEYVKPSDLKEVAENGDHRKAYATVVRRKDHLVHKDGGKFNLEEYSHHPERFRSVFSEMIAPYSSCIINGIFWDVNHPRFLSNMDTKTLLSPEMSPKTDESPGCPRLPHRLLAICDITADPGGAIEFVSECTSIEAPFTLYDADHRHQHFKSLRFSGDGVLVCSIDNMPTQLPREATDFFGDLLLPWVPEMLKSDATIPLEKQQLSRVVYDAVIASNGSLAPKYHYITDLRKKTDPSLAVINGAEKQRVLLLGSGYVSSPVVEYLTRDGGIEVTIASSIKEEAENIASKYDNTEAVYLNVKTHEAHLHQLVKKHDIVISLLPIPFHPMVAEICLQQRKNLVTASYTSPAMKALHKDAVDAGVTFLNECGLDPGIDHMLSMECFDYIHDKGGKVTSFESYAGGLPAPEHSENPLRYKFSWSPFGVLSGLGLDAKYLSDKKEVYIPPGYLMESCKDMSFLPGFNLQGYPNRDSTQYIFTYGVQTVDSFIRGSLRYKGYCHAANGLLKLGLVDGSPHPALHEEAPAITWRELMSNHLGHDSGTSASTLKEIVCEKLGDEDAAQVVEDLGLLADSPAERNGTLLQSLSNHLSKRLAYKEGERDLVIMRNQAGVEWSNGNCETHEISLVVYGEPDGFSAMAKTVGYPAAIGAKMILEGEIVEKGVMIPLGKNIYKPILNRLKAEDIRATTNIKYH
ncbi:alpha-aminoadipic semialdehyde synthase, mitochondrial-like isoform X4 [Anneissia japonica]|uniref:alpha-aminoadipic semialdehyde synthase, mitochondrial-like isoform X3 n=1 Tax=Anneissia japonica TaxID=1529436 RepID=UPI0014257CB7|nr:alpha-aminoadipic semialdehyde synthase, mitochondrial-like isoform X3 [Anneissia japonica]XP_033106547.1 alpha-aminoadipic semialdehyde synthase, mitochondrial-like isoform X4 [Anneissia japonica]